MSIFKNNLHPSNVFKSLTSTLLATSCLFFSIAASANSGYVNVNDYTAHVYTANGFTPLYAKPSDQSINKYRWVPQNRITSAATSGYQNVEDYTAHVYTANGFTPLYAKPSDQSINKYTSSRVGANEQNKMKSLP